MSKQKKMEIWLVAILVGKVISSSEMPLLLFLFGGGGGGTGSYSQFTDSQFSCIWTSKL